MYFLRSAHRELAPSNTTCDIFNNERNEENESKRITQHHIDDRIDYLYKSEGGKNKMAKIFSDICVQTLGIGMDLYMMVDLDGDLTNKLVNMLNRALMSDYHNAVSVFIYDRISNSDLLVLDCRLEVDGRGNHSICIIAFHQKLETATGIRYNDSISEIEHKSARYIDNNPDISNDIQDALY